MEPEPGDEFIRRTAEFIRTHEPGLAAASPVRRRRTTKPPSTSDVSMFNPLGWFSYDTAAQPDAKPVVLQFDYHHLFYLFIRMEALGLDVGSLDVRVDNPSRPMNYINIPSNDKSDSRSLMSFRSSLSAVSRLSLGPGWWGRPPPPTVDSELKYIYSSITKVPALALHAPEPRLVTEMAAQSPMETALPLDAFKNLQSLQCTDIDPRTILGWDRLAESLRSLTVKRSGLEDVSDIFLVAVADDQARREGLVSSLKSKRLTRGVSRQSSFHGTRLPESVPEDDDEDDEDREDPDSPRTPKRTTASQLPSYKWAFLRHLSLSDNSLTFLPSSPLPYLVSVTHLDLSSNLLVSVPPGLNALYNLVYLNLSDNMIDSVLGIYTMLGSIVTLNLSRNRLESICGLERLLALERVDLRHNLVEESAEIGRLATLPNIAEVSIEGNPLVEIEEGYRARCFDLFYKEKKHILLDGSAPGFYEKKYLTTPPSDQMTSSRPRSVAYSPPVVAVSGSSHFNPSPLHSSPTSSPASHPSSPANGPANGRGRRKKNKRIVDLDGGHDNGESGSPLSAARAIPASRTMSPTKRPSEARATSPPGPSSLREGFVAPTPPPPQEPESPSTPTAPVTPVKQKSRHSRHQTEFSALDNASIVPQVGSVRQASTLTRSAKRRARVSASVYEPAREEEANQYKEADAFRARIEALRADMGDGWLKVFNQSHLGSPPPGVKTGS